MSEPLLVSLISVVAWAGRSHGLRGGVYAAFSTDNGVITAGTGATAIYAGALTRGATGGAHGARKGGAMMGGAAAMPIGAETDASAGADAAATGI